MQGYNSCSIREREYVRPNRGRRKLPLVERLPGNRGSKGGKDTGGMGEPKLIARDEDGNPQIDEDGNTVWRACRSVEDELKGTQEHHQQWMSNSGGERHSIYTRLIPADDDDVPAKLELTPDAELTEEALLELLDPKKRVDPYPFC
mmetsp:Transcript_21663/g.47239  ORF Transcript_21663/g.47239 Transcript_21663/m.47239 type:complete len:146 (+) Transcript_21663:133-570(+)